MPSGGVAGRGQAFRARRTGPVYTRTSVVQRTLVTRVVACDVNTLPRNIIIITITRARFVLASCSGLRYNCTPRRPRRWSIGRTGLPESGRQNAISASYDERSDQQLNIIINYMGNDNVRPSCYRLFLIVELLVLLFTVY